MSERGRMAPTLARRGKARMVGLGRGGARSGASAAAACPLRRMTGWVDQDHDKLGLAETTLEKQLRILRLGRYATAAQDDNPFFGSTRQPVWLIWMRTIWIAQR